MYNLQMGFSLDPLRRYDGETITIELPGDMTIFNIDWLAVFDLNTDQNYGSVLIPDGLNVPPSLVKIIVSPGALNQENIYIDLFHFSAASQVTAQLQATAQGLSCVMGGVWATDHHRAGRPSEGGRVYVVWSERQ